MTINPERVMVAIITLLSCFMLISLDAAGYINIGKFGYAGIGSWITIVIQFYFRKKPSEDTTQNGVPTSSSPSPSMREDKGEGDK